MKNFKLILSTLLCGFLLTTSCSKEGDDTTGGEKAAAPSVTSFTLEDCNGVIDNKKGVIEVSVPSTTDVSNAVAEIVVPEGQTCSIDGEAKDYTQKVEFSVTNSDGVKRDYTVNTTIEAAPNANAEYVFIGEEASISLLHDDDAKAAAEWMSKTYSDNFKYIQISEINAEALESAKVAMLYYLTTAEGTYGASSDDIQTMLPAELCAGTEQTKALTAWAKNGGNLLLGCDATPFIFNMGRVPADFSQPKAPGNYVFGEVANGSVEFKNSDDIWGLAVKAIASPTDITTHAIFKDIELTDDKYIALNNSAAREVRLIWWNVFDGMIVNGCSQEAVVAAQNKLNMLRLGTLKNIADGFGYGLIEWLPTNSGTHADFDTTIPNDFKGTVISIENTIIGYEWGTDGSNEYQSNIEKLTANILNYLYDLAK